MLAPSPAPALAASWLDWADAQARRTFRAIWLPEHMRPSRIPAVPDVLQPAQWHNLAQLHDVHVRDAEQLMGELQSRSVGAVLLDIPDYYGIEGSEDQSAIDEQLAALEQLAAQCRRILRCGGVTLVTARSTTRSAWDIAANRAGLSSLNDMAVLWENARVKRPYAMANAPSLKLDLLRHVNPGLREPFHATSPHHVRSDVMAVTPVPESRRAMHYQHPVEMYISLIRLFTDPDDLVVDPMCGTGSALVAAAMTGRRWIGGDIDREMVQLARRRVSDTDSEELGDVGWWYDKHVNYENE